MKSFCIFFWMLATAAAVYTFFGYCVFVSPGWESGKKTDWMMMGLSYTTRATETMSKDTAGFLFFMWIMFNLVFIATVLPALLMLGGDSNWVRIGKVLMNHTLDSEKAKIF